MITPYGRLRSGTVSAARLALASALVLALASCALVQPLTERSEGAAEPGRPAAEPRQPADAPERDADEPDPVPPGEAPGGDEPDGEERASDAEPDAAGRERAEPDDVAELPRETPERDEPAWRELAAGQQSAVRVPVARAVSDSGLWRDLWFAMTANRIEPPDPPEVDFSRETVVVLILGERPTGGYAVTIAAVVERRDEVEVVIDVITPEADAIVTQALTTPYYVAAIPVAAKPVRFTGESLEAGFRGD